MMKKFLLAMGLASTVSVTFATGQYYIGPGITWNRITSSHSSYTGVAPLLTWGYADIVGRSYLAGELFGTLGTLQVHTQPRNGIPLKTTSSVGIAFLPGLIMKQIYVGYFRIAYLYSYFSGIAQFQPGLQIGLGLQADVSSHWSVRGEYDYTAFATSGRLGSPRSNQLGMSALYRFS